MHQEIAPILTSAREEHIAIDPRSLIPSSLCRLPPLLPVTDIHEPFCFADDPLNKPPLPTFIIPQEKLIADNDTKISLASVIAAANSSFEVPDTDPEFDRANFRVRELEEPLVRADFTRDLVLRKSYIPKPILLDECKDEGLTWPPSAIEDVAKYQRTLQAEKLSGGEGVVKLLQAWVAEPKVDEDGLDPAMIKLPPFEPITPPLLPVFSPTLPSIDDVAAGLETLPEQTNSELLNDIETEFLEADGFTCYTPTSSVFKVSSPITSPMRVAPDPETRKIEVPLSPLTPVSATKRVRFSSILATDSGLKIPKEETHHDEVREFEDVVKLRVEQLKREVEQEQLQEADSTMRVPVSVLDFGLPKLAVVDIDAVKAWAQIPRNRWAGIRSLEIALRWAPFSGEARKIPLEPLENDVDPQYFILSDKDIKEAEDTLIKSLESACLDDDSDDEEEVLEPAQFDGKVVDSILDVQELVRRKRRRAREQLDCSATTKKPRPMDKNPSIAERFSAGTSLENFMNMRTRKPVQTRGTPKPGQALSLKPPKSPAGATSKSMLVQPAAHVPRERPIIAFPPPKLGDITKREFFIASTAILASAPFLIRRIRDIYPTATIYERDFSAPLRSAEPLFLNCAAPTLPEADILLSPMAGLVYTTLEVLRQRPLPGQPCLYGSGEQLKARIIGLSTRYERLIVIVKLPIGGAKGSDAGALAGFIGFTAALCRTCTIVIRPVEGIATVPEWVVAAMTDERDVWSGEKGLMEEETTWERLLRKLGLNAYAAQEMAKRLVKLEPEGGLAALLRMDSEEIVARFADVVGGRCVERLVEVLDRRWGERSFSRTAFCFAGGSRRSSLRACRVTLPSSGT